MTTTPSPVRRGRVNEIDLLRFCAAMAVVLYHYAFRGYAADGLSEVAYPALAPFAKYGYLGVQLFFMISGFVILMTAANGSIRSFLVSRVVRLYPAFWACCTLTFGTILVLGTTATPFSLREYLVNLTMFSGFTDVRSIDGSYWSLFVEMRFYALVAVVLLLRRMRNAQWLLAGWLAASFALETVYVRPLYRGLIVDYSPFFIAGAACFLIWNRGVCRVTAALVAGSWILAVWHSLEELPAFERHYSAAFSPLVVVAWITAFFVILLLVAFRRTGPLAHRQWTTLGAVTYPLYLLHQAIGFSIFNAAYPVVHPQVLLWGTIALMVALSYGVHIVIERPATPAMKRAMNRCIDAIGGAFGRGAIPAATNADRPRYEAGI